MRIVIGLFGKQKAIWEGTPIKNYDEFISSANRALNDEAKRGWRVKGPVKSLFSGHHVMKDPKKKVWYLFKPNGVFIGMYGSEEKAHRARKLANAGKIGMALALAIGGVTALAANQGAFS